MRHENESEPVSHRVSVNLTEGVARSTQGTETLAGIEDVHAIYTPDEGNAEVIGNDLPNTITTGWGDDVIMGMGGDDVLTATSGDDFGLESDLDRVDGGDGSDVCRLSEDTTNCENQ